MSTISNAKIDELYAGCQEGFTVDAATGIHLIQAYRELVRERDELEKRLDRGK